MVYNKIKKKYLYVFFLSMPFIVTTGNIYADNLNKSVDKPEIWMTIFVHGIIKGLWSISDITKIFNNKVESSRYKYYAEFMRKYSKFEYLLPIQNLGLEKIDLNQESGNASTALACIHEVQYKQNIINLYYTFGWSGLLSRFHREQEAKDLVKSLKRELEVLRNKNIYPKIRLIGFSHGGNVSINIARYIPTRNLPFSINELILLGTPIQHDNDYLINHPVFQNVYNIYSMNDIAQIADFLTSRSGFSHRKFKSRKNFTIPSKLKQIQIQVTKLVYNDCGNIIRNYYADPGHIELWNFGWSPMHYRCGFPLNPLSVVSLLPFIIKSTKAIEDSSKDLKLDIKVQESLVKIKDNKTKCKYEIDFPKVKFNELKKIAQKYKINYTYCDHLKITRQALTYASEQIKNDSKCKMKIIY